MYWFSESDEMQSACRYVRFMHYALINLRFFRELRRLRTIIFQRPYIDASRRERGKKKATIQGALPGTLVHLKRRDR